jgi:UDP-N-acetylglucosamine:LPS N-acetylglucosamine transferase
MKRILAVASGGGHFVQLLRLRPAFEGSAIHYVTTNSGYSKQFEGSFFIVKDANADQRLKLIWMLLQMGRIFLSVRPDVVISTGAAPGLAAMVLGKIFRAKTLWLDSIANSEELSQSGRLARRFADVWLTQWEHLARDDGPHFWGGVL